MGRQLLPPNTGPGYTGIWVSIGMGRRRSFPIRVVATGDFTGDDVYIEELSSGNPGSQSIFGNNAAFGPGNSPLMPDTDWPAANVVIKQVGTIGPALSGGQTTDLVTEYPTSEYIRARTGTFTSGTVGICIVETLE
jgi:hypothetical protein